MAPDVNVLVAASRSDHIHHRPARNWIEQSLAACALGGSFCLLPMVAAGFLRLVTHPKIFVEPTPTPQALAFIDALLAINGVTMPSVGAEWPNLRRLCVQRRLRGNDFPDAWIAAAVRTAGMHLVTFDKGFSRLLEKSEWTLLTSS